MPSVASDYNATECPISLPPELLLHIFSFLSTASGSIVAQVSKRFNILVTPLVWTSIKLSDLFKAHQYLATCSLLGSQHDLLSMVRSFEIELLALSVRNCSLMAEHAAAEGVEELLPKILDWMQNLEHFRFVSERWAFQGDFILDMVGHKSVLKSLKLDLAAFLLCGDTISAANLPNLETLYLTANCASVGGRIQNWISNLVDDHTALINDFQIHGIRPEKIIPNNDDSWSSLQTLRIACSGLYMPYALKMPHVKQLSIPVPYLNGRNRDPVTPAPPIFPDLEVLRALPETVMRSGLLKGRPIHTLELDDIHLYEDDGVYSAGVGRVAPENETLANIFHQLKESSTPLRSLSFLMKALQIDFLLHCLMPFKHLRYLKLMISVGWLVCVI